MSSTYEIRVEGHLDAHWSSVLGGLALRRDSDGRSTLTGPVADQSQLHGVLAGLRDVGAHLVSVRELVASSALGALDWPKRTARLEIRPVRPLDAEPTWRFRRQESVCRWLTAGDVGLHQYAATFTDPGSLGPTLVVELEGRVVGDLMVRIEDARAQVEVADRARAAQAELGWVLDPSLNGHGYATEAVRELVRICFEDLGLRRVVATCLAENEASWRLMERVGMRRELHAVADALHRSGTWSDTYGYALLRDPHDGAHAAMVEPCPP